VNTFSNFALRMKSAWQFTKLGC